MPSRIDLSFMTVGGAASIAAASGLVLALSVGSAKGAPRVPADGATPGMSESRREAIIDFVREQMRASRVMGLAVVVVRDHEVLLQEGFGLADAASKRPVTTRTVFELGSTSKAFTALALLLLERRGLLRLDDPVDRYLPWFTATFRRKPASITLSHLLHHTSGIPSETIAAIPESREPSALEATVKGASGLELASAPGSAYQYATVNYDIAALVAQVASGQPFEAVMAGHVFAPLGLGHTALWDLGPHGPDLARGHKLGFLRARGYDPPSYRGNAPAGYVLTNAEDLGTWMKLHLGAHQAPAIDPLLVLRTHTPDPSRGDSHYGMGWARSRDSGVLDHDGLNPAFSSYILIDPKLRLGIGVLCNTASLQPRTIGIGIRAIVQGEPPPERGGDTLRTADDVATAVVAVSVSTLVASIGVAIRARLRPSHVGTASRLSRRWRLVLLSASSLGLGAAAWGLSQLPRLLYGPVPWKFLAIWTPYSIPTAAGSLFLALLAVYLHVVSRLLPRQGERGSASVPRESGASQGPW